jgi:tetraacyldisaccharide 4'-kinase
MIMRTFAAALQCSWYAKRPWLWLWPFAGVYGGIVGLRRGAYRRGWRASVHPGVPVLVVGNITVGGSGKTPLTLELAARLAGRGRRVGIVARGYGGRSAHYPLAVTAATPAATAGDEPVLLARRGAAAVAVDPNRARATCWLVEHRGVDFVIADDGLQHYPLARDAEIAVMDARRGPGNGYLLPAGPLREPVSRLAAVDLILVLGPDRDFWLTPGALRRLDGQNNSRMLGAFTGATVHAVAGIGDPARFFAMLRGFAIDIIEHAMPDHHAYTAADLDFGDDYPVLMTEKDAVKCVEFADPRHWVVPVALAFAPAVEARVETLQDRLCAQPGIGAGRP